jgi:hypothetical protein
MDRLLDSFKVTNNQTYTIMYFLIFAGVVLTIFGAIGLVYFIRNGFTIQPLTQALTQVGQVVQPYLPNIALNTILYILSGVIFVLILYILIGSPRTDRVPKDNQGIIPNNKLFWQPESADNPLDPRNLRVKQEDWQPTNCTGMSLGAEMVIFNSRAPSANSPYRHILHRGSEDLTLYEPPSSSSSSSRGSPGTGAVAGSGGLADGLPSEMSPGVFIDRFTNDLIIYVDTDPVDPTYSGAVHAFRESIRVNDIPLNIPFYLHLSINGKVMEVYINCKLAGTKLLHGKLRSMPTEWYGRTGFATAQAVVQNLTLWDGPLNTFDVMKLCKKKIHIKKEAWELLSLGSIPILNISKCGDVSVGSEEINIAMV